MCVRPEGLAKDRPHLPMTASQQARRETRSGARAAVAACAVFAVCSLGAPPPAHAQSGGGNGTIYVGTYAKKILVVNEANLKVVDSIPVSVGIPYITVLSSNRKHFYVLDPQVENVEVIDIATRKVIDKFTLS